jgi:uncharacterized protein YbcI
MFATTGFGEVAPEVRSGGIRPLDALRGVTRNDLEDRFAGAFQERTGAVPARTTVIECDDLLVIRADGTLTRSQGVLASRDPSLVSELSRTMLDDIAHESLWEIAEELTGELVSAVLTDQSVDPDVALICFVLDRSER